MTFFRCQIDNSGDTKSLDDDRMTPLAHAMERGAGKSAEFLLNHGTLLTTCSLLSRDYNKAYNLLLMYILNFEPVIKRTGFFSITARQRGTVDDFLYEVDTDGSSLLHLAVNSGVLAVSIDRKSVV